MKLKLLSVLSLVLFNHAFAQSEKFYATTDSENAKELKAKFPGEIDIVGVEETSPQFILQKMLLNFFITMLLHTVPDMFTSRPRNRL
jgi:leucyl aminopeptidase